MSVRRGRSMGRPVILSAGMPVQVPESGAFDAGGWGGVFADQAEAAAALAVLDAGHVGLDQEDATAGQLFEVALVGGIRDIGAVEPRSLVLDDDLGGVAGDVPLDVDALGLVHLVAVLDRV